MYRRLINPIMFRNMIRFRKSSFSNIFRNLTKNEGKAVDLYDFRNKDQNNKILITCEHAINEYF